MVDLARLLTSDGGIENTSLSVRHFKSFGSNGFTIDGIRNINLVVGRNNVGKSSVLDAVRYLCGNFTTNPSHSHKGTSPSFTIALSIGDGISRSMFPETTSGGWIGGNHWAAVGKPLSESGIRVRISGKSKPSFEELIPGKELLTKKVTAGYNQNYSLVDYEHFQSALKSVAERVQNPFANWSTLRIAAERDVNREARSSVLELSENGSGLTNIIAKVITSANYDSGIVEKEYLNRVNSILAPDLLIDSVSVQEHDDSSWEIFFDEGEKGRISLSNSGSGIKTVLLVVAATFLLPRLGLTKNEGIIFLIEEPENNLHPALQRRLASYLFDVVEGGKNKIIVTSHSSAIIDAFATQKESQIIHVSSRDGQTITNVVDSQSSRRGILDELDARASDILLSNGVIWVEGPSDRIYINRWIELATSGEIREGLHYQCVFYGGRLLSHLAADIDEGRTDPDYINIFHVSRNAAIIIDSDRKSEKCPINATKERIAAEITDSGGLRWITHGREIENYLAGSLLSKFDARMNRELGRYEEIEEYLKDTLGDQDGARLIRSKSQFAALVSEIMEVEDIGASAPLAEHLNELISEIRRWNGI